MYGFFLSLSLKHFVRFANAYHLSMWDELVGSRANGLLRTLFARSSQLASSESGVPVLVRVRLSPFIAHAPDIRTQRCCPSPPRACSSRCRSPFLVGRPRPVE